jgi:hypothetical protein
MTSQEWKEKAKYFRQSAKEDLQKREESWERSDTDGFLSQWALGLGASLRERLAQICDNEGMSEFRTLYNLKGEKQNVKVIKTRFGDAWAFCDLKGKFTGKFIGYYITEKSLRKKGYYVDFEMRPAWATITSDGGRGLSGNCWVETFEVKHPETFHYSEWGK